MRLRVQIRNDQDDLLTEWIVPDGEGLDGDLIDREIEWLRRPFDDEGKTNAQAIAEGLLYEVGADG